MHALHLEVYVESSIAILSGTMLLVAEVCDVQKAEGES